MGLSASGGVAVGSIRSATERVQLRDQLALVTNRVQNLEAENVRLKTEVIEI